MGVQLDQRELDEFLERSHTMILSTLKESGEPFMTPLWYVYTNGCIYFSTPSRSAKIKHLKRDPRVCCLIEEEQHWIDLKAVVMSCEAEFVETGSEEATQVRELMDGKYQAFRPQFSKAPSATKKHYSGGTTVVKLVPRQQEIRSWYNRKIRGFDQA